MKKYLVILLVGLVGCTTTVKQRIKTVMDKYETVNYADGIDLEEAKIISQRALVKQNLVDRYDIEKPEIIRDVTELPNYEDYWFLSFKESKFSSIEYAFMVVIERKTGKVKFADDIQDEKRWIIEASLLK